MGAGQLVALVTQQVESLLLLAEGAITGPLVTAPLCWEVQ